MRFKKIKNWSTDNCIIFGLRHGHGTWGDPSGRPPWGDPEHLKIYIPSY